MKFGIFCNPGCKISEKCFLLNTIILLNEKRSLVWFDLIGFGLFV